MIVQSCYELPCNHVSSVQKVHSGAISVQSAHLGVVGVIILEVVVTHKHCVLLIDNPIATSQHEGSVQQAWSGGNLRRRQSECRDVRRSDGYWLWVPARHLLVRPEVKQLVLDDSSASVSFNVFHLDIRLRQRLVCEEWIRCGVLPTLNVLKLPMKRVSAVI